MPWPYPPLDGRPADDPLVESLAAEIAGLLGALGYTAHTEWWNAARITPEGPLSPMQLWRRGKYDTVNDLFMKDAETKGVPLPLRRADPEFGVTPTRSRKEHSGRSAYLMRP
jgi:hypothetical protein